MRLGKEQATGVIQESAGVGSVPVDEPGEGRADDERSAAATPATLSLHEDVVPTR